MERVEDAVLRDASQQVASGLNRPQVNATPKVRGMDPAAEGAADPAVAVEEQDVFRRRHDPSIA